MAQLIEGRLYAIEYKFNNKNRFIEEVTFLKNDNNCMSFSKLSYDGKILKIIIGKPSDFEIYKRVNGEWTNINTI